MIVKTAVVLMLESGAVAPQSPDWYRRFFLSWNSGAGQYWYKQSNGGISFEGDVVGWLTYPQAPDWNDRESLVKSTLDVANPVVWALQGTAVPDSANVAMWLLYDVCIIFVARLNNQGVAAGSVSGLRPSQPGQRLSWFVVLDTKSAFDFCAHEIGHALHLAHSFDDTEQQYAAWKTFGGEYGHPCCVMAAQTYGRAAAVWTPTLPAVHPIAMDRIPPSLNGWYASLAGWTSRTDWSVGDSDRVIELESLGSWPGPLPKVVRIKGSDANEYSIEYRNKADYFDSGLPSSALVVNQGTGGRAFRAQGGGATYLGAIDLPLKFNSARSVFNHGENDHFAVEVLDWTGTSVVLRLSNGVAKPQKVSVTVSVEDQGTQREPLGDFDFTGAGVHCVTGIWSVTRALKSRLARLTLKAAAWPQPFATRWWVDGQELIGSSGTVQISTKVESPLPLPRGQTTSTLVNVGFLVKGADEIALTNVAKEGNYTVTVTCTAGFGVGEFKSTDVVEFEGEELEYPDGFEPTFIACLIQERDRNRPQKTRRIVLPESDLPRPQLNEPHNQRVFEALENVDGPPLADAVHRQLFRQVTGYAARRARVVPMADGALADLTSRKGFVIVKTHQHGIDKDAPGAQEPHHG